MQLSLAKKCFGDDHEDSRSMSPIKQTKADCHGLGVERFVRPVLVAKATRPSIADIDAVCTSFPVRDDDCAAFAP